MTICQECDSNGKCWARERAKIYGISEYGFISGEDAMIKEIINRGPYLNLLKFLFKFIYIFIINKFNIKINKYSM